MSLGAEIGGARDTCVTFTSRMPAAFIADRAGLLSDGLVLNLEEARFAADQVILDHLRYLFPDGVTRWGARYLTRGGPELGLEGEPESELTLEFVRRTTYPERPSRFQAFFGNRSVADAQAFAADFGSPGAPIWRAEADEVFVADMNCCGHGLPGVLMSYFAHRYWRGEQGPEGDGLAPRWEVLMVPPVTVVERAA